MPSLAKRSNKRVQHYKALTARNTAEMAYVSGLRAVMRGIQKVYTDYMFGKLPEIAKKADHNDGITPWSGELDALGIHVQSQVPAKVAPLFTRMSSTIAKANAVQLYQVFGIKPSELGIDVEIAHARERNIRLVQDAGRKYAADVREVFESPENTGLRVEAIKELLLDRGRVWYSRAELLARDQTLKLNGTINAVRQKNAGVTEYVWSTSKDERVRDSHAALEGQTFTWGVPPMVGEPGQDYQCRCVGVPVISELEGV